jgi:hypothetical protein
MGILMVLLLAVPLERLLAAVLADPSARMMAVSMVMLWVN